MSFVACRALCSASELCVYFLYNNKKELMTIVCVLCYCFLLDTAGTRADLAAILAALRRAAPPREQFPCSSEDLDPIHEKFILHADSKYISLLTNTTYILLHFFILSFASRTNYDLRISLEIECTLIL